MTAFSRFLFAPRQGFSTFMSPLQLWPLYIAGMTRPVTDADGGINIAVVEEHDGGVLTVLDPYPDMAAGDAISILVADEPVHQIRVTPDDLDKRLMFYLPVANFIPGTLECHYVLTRAGETAPDDPSVRLKLRVKLDNPAGADKEPHKPGHSELKMVGLPQDVIDNGVSKEWATQGVPMTVARYPGITLRDHIYVKWGNVFLLPHEVTQAEVDGAEIIITATPADILSGGDSNKLLIHYQVYDEVWNFSEKWSQQANVAVEAGASRLEPAIFKEADEGQIQLKDLDHQPATLLIHIQSGGVFEAGDTVMIRIIGTPIPGSPSRTFTAEVILRTPAYVLEQSIPYEFVSLFAMGTMDASYELHKKNGDRHSSKRTWASVIGNPSQLPAPAINEVIGATLPADSPLATVLIRYPSMANGDFINLIWEGIRSNGNPYVHEEQHSVSDNEQREGLVTVYVASEHIQALANGSLKLYYRVATDVEDDDGVSESDYLRVEVGTLRATLPSPEVEEAVDGIIDPSQANTQVSVRIKPVAWAKGDTLTYYWIGTSPLVSTQDSLPITELGIGEPRRFRVAARFVSGNIGHIVTVRYTLRHAATGKFSYSLPLSVMIGEPVGFLPPPEVVQAPDGTLDPMKGIDGVDIQCRYASMDATLDTLGLKWRGTPGAGTSQDLEKPANTSGMVAFHLPASVVGANIRRSVNVNYEVGRYGRWTPSENLPLNILGFQKPETDLPRPEVPQAVNAVLDLMEFTGEARVLVKPWPFIAEGQLVWLKLEGRTGTGTHFIELLKAHRVTVAQVTQGLDQPLLRTELAKLLHSSPATVTCKVIFDGSTEESAAIDFPNLALTIRTRYDYLTPVITSVQSPQNIEIRDNDLTYDKSVTIHGTATRGEKVDVKLNGVSVGRADVVPPGTWVFPTADLPMGSQRITVEALYDADPTTSLPRTFTVAVASRPEITGVTDVRGNVPPNETTYETSVTVAVKADSNQRVQLYDGAATIGAPITLNAAGVGSLVLPNLAPKNYSLKA
ncbi:Ig-like domain repeat protein, partial [Pseudomonas sp. PB106]|uniref:Ig-like domain repeat protein n=1 Tax=Pseudomonas sp. PB106 TaxID=2494699 RepID=UPI00131D7193